MNGAGYSLGPSALGSPLRAHDRLAACRCASHALVMPPGRALLALALGPALLLCGCAGQNFRADVRPFDPANRALAANPGLPGPAAAKATFVAMPAPAAAHFDSRNPRNPAHAVEAEYSMQPMLGGFRLDADGAAQSPGGLPARAWSMGFSGKSLFKGDDHTSFVVYLPMKNNKAVRKVVGTIFQSEDVGAIASDIQALSMIARGRVNTEFRYSTRFNKFSSLDASATYRNNAHTDPVRSDLVLGISYRAAF